MANFFPSFEGIREMKVPPTKGEWEFLNFLKAYPDNELEVFFQPNINGDNPDIVLMKKSHGVLIIEVKDWNLDNYYICLLYTSPSPRDRQKSRMPSSA